ncbi:MAG: polyprenyl synthetase family protein [Clostridiales bacterium]|jgi:geranylgeranyl pyrophosphate synthase|nr:polyprenyl synthetase family protein [Clostridiales bacterium]
MSNNTPNEFYGKEYKSPEFTQKIDDYRKKIDDYMRNLIKELVLDVKLKEGMEYALFNGGKRIRPILTLGVYEMIESFNKKAEKNAEDTENASKDADENDDINIDITPALPFAAAVEMVHVASLIQDDLPCMDDDDERRGKPSLHVKYNESSAILASDSLICLAFEAIVSNQDFNPYKVLEAARTLSFGFGANGVQSGQMLDLNTKLTTVDDYNALNLKKTATLIMTACLFGAILAGANMDEYTNIGEFGKNLGLAFQLKDDLLDFDTDENNLAILLGKKDSQELLDKYTEEAKFNIHKFGESSFFLQDLSNYLLNRDI